MSKIIALYSPAPQSGKSTIANALNGLGYRTVKFAGTLKDMVRTMLLGAGIPYDTVERMVEGDLKEKPIKFPGFEVTPRHLMQTLGTEWGRSIHPNIWCDLAINKALTASGRVVIDDMRFVNEFYAVQAEGGITIKVERPGCYRPENCHPSEGQLDAAPFDFKIINSGTVDELVGKVLDCIHRA